MSMISGSGVLSAQDRWIDVFGARKFDEALMISDRELKQRPGDPKLWTERALALEALDRNAESITSFRRALTLKPSFTPALEGAAELTYKTRDPRAKSFLAKLLEIDPHNATAHAMAGVLAFEGRDCPLAIGHFEKAGPNLVGNEQAYSLYGACLLEMNKAQKAAPVFASLLERVPESVNVRYNLGYAQFLNGNAAGAIATLRGLAKGDRADASALNLIASAEAAEGQLAAALSDLRAAAHLKPEAEENYLDFASLCLEHNSPDLAEEIINIGLQNLPASARLYSMRGIVDAQKSKFDDSASDFEQANRLSPDKSYGSVGLSMLYAESKHPEDSERILRQKLRAAPNDATLNYLFADILMNQSKTMSGSTLAEAKAALARAIAARPKFSNAHALLGKVYRRMGDGGKAIQEFRLALADNPQNRVALTQIVSLLRGTDREKEAAPYSATLRGLVQQELKDDVSQSRVRIVRVP
jgi:tetratricopeptide (TPR) repeat protein